MKLIADIWNSFRSMPLWVQVWVFAILVPVNSAAIFFLTQPLGWWVGVLAIGGMLPNLVMLGAMRGFSKGMALSHVVAWGPLVALVIPGLLALPDLAPAYRVFLWILLAVDLVSLGFDVVDTVKWFRGDRAVAGR